LAEVEREVPEGALIERWGRLEGELAREFERWLG
jgi:hypothetical protein